MKQQNRPVPAEYFDEFFAPLVGGQAETDALRASLVAAVADDRHEPDPYVRLAGGLQVAADSAIGDRTQVGDARSRADWARVASNALTGNTVTIQGLRTLGTLYHQHASEPQTPANVRRNTGIMVGHMYGYAQIGGLASSISAEALHLGLNPRKLWHVFRIFMHVSNHGISGEDDARAVFHQRSFTVAHDPEGQLTVRPRYRKRSKAGGKHCPAVDAQKVPGDKRLRPAMFTMLQTLGDVALSEIYPQQFVIATDRPEHTA